MEDAQIIELGGKFANGATLTSPGTITIPLGTDAAGNMYEGEEIESFANLSAAQVPEPASSSLAALGMAATPPAGRSSTCSSIGNPRRNLRSR